MVSLAPVEISARVLFLTQDRVLLANRRGQSWFYLPGGNVSPGETVEAALRRETREQAGLDVTDLEFIGCAEHVYVENDVRYQEINVLFAADLPWGAQIGSWEFDVDLTAVALASLRGLDLRPVSLRAVIDGWLAHRRPTWYGAPALTGTG
ncbi:NUDIX hydrolase [Parafrankia colletiae]|uniref:NUDIX hydrolase n=1 Tax=Parafrankia colletiae TaxID=573497 RepID=A0A1S1QSD8_9ACTN|nr:NUDIX domain-containing protein [Parafrankia colletiae]MCK9901007.1 NUDIX domain-containing protein [Frankia sp. Cpl3]OHV36195.1 NUDIX hydrolase [Parafrankia colletiae]